MSATSRHNSRKPRFELRLEPAQAPSSASSAPSHESGPAAGLWLLSGGIESAALIHDWSHAATGTSERVRGTRFVHIDYGQRNASAEWSAVQRLTDCIPESSRPRLQRIDVSTLRAALRRDNGWTPHVPPPERNLLLIALARNLALAHGLKTIVIGLTADDASHGPDGDALRIQALARCLAGDRIAIDPTISGGINVLCPLATQRKHEVIGTRPAAPWALAWSCLLDQPRPCGACPQCEARARAFATAQRHDPLLTPD
ncbi:MAG: 7-cyano-7-deazaguanine synthase [Thioalkalivibrionaceae bacterium]